MRQLELFKTMEAQAGSEQDARPEFRELRSARLRPTASGVTSGAAWAAEATATCFEKGDLGTPTRPSSRGERSRRPRARSRAPARSSDLKVVDALRKSGKTAPEPDDNRGCDRSSRPEMRPMVQLDGDTLRDPGTLNDLYRRVHNRQKRWMKRMLASARRRSSSKTRSAC